MLSRREQVIKQAQENLKKAQERQKTYYDRKRADKETLERTTVSSKKVIPKWIGPYKILKKLSDNVMKLKLPPNIKMRPTFNVGQTQAVLWKSRSIGKFQIPKSRPIIFNDEGEQMFIIKLY
ncbi:FOG: Transposon-encoded proteins with TYA, reverse transcriptase, integrase domains in various combinations [Plasmopara halstedii]|uniref:FOG: Transposon-encoded proteins with TYA, reverse transcriptase, integrase domains in various combinations n=1 Tax=Plasmopara halstedii TaxID=4781 RepID=A0A0N7L7C6_PLAHL|nr:FOG: Transposon-encoded proteins with TYA, reverse transcriptase, integrase domains in various combinations [Plasmopara halstedii]CEG46699.1 FOG: Transposon-encoded proteins with TYA, reverse transcriptase, integrase domains in various combinations [Plasmopara halstedii]|eukprot:XP_024583068.1 FOG: Transposon-encoded proteins with TYA, reverse transcriptase, integrase domains in various combinations [Plasmopara halstedii]